MMCRCPGCKQPWQSELVISFLYDVIYQRDGLLDAVRRDRPDAKSNCFEKERQWWPVVQVPVRDYSAMYTLADTQSPPSFVSSPSSSPSSSSKASSWFNISASLTCLFLHLIAFSAFPPIRLFVCHTFPVHCHYLPINRGVGEMKWLICYQRDALVYHRWWGLVRLRDNGHSHGSCCLLAVGVWLRLLPVIKVELVFEFNSRYLDCNVVFGESHYFAFSHGLSDSGSTDNDFCSVWRKTYYDFDNQTCRVLPSS